MYFATMVVQRQVGHPGQSGEVIEVWIQRLGLEDKGDDSRTNVKAHHVFRWAIDGRGYSFAPPVKDGKFAEKNPLEEVGMAPGGPSFADGRVGFEIFIIVPCVVYDEVEELLRESWRHGGEI